MKKNIKKDVPQVSETPSSNARSFFTKEVLSQMAEMTNSEMENLLKETINTREFVAHLKYVSLRTPLLDAALRSTDPTKDPAKISWSQGAMAGLEDVQSYIFDLNAPKPESEEREEGEPAGGNPAGVIIG